jgi:hypothetical protein
MLTFTIGTAAPSNNCVIPRAVEVGRRPRDVESFPDIPKTRRLIFMANAENTENTEDIEDAENTENTENISKIPYGQRLHVSSREQRNRAHEVVSTSPFFTLFSCSRLTPQTLRSPFCGYTRHSHHSR